MLELCSQRPSSARRREPCLCFVKSCAKPTVELLLAVPLVHPRFTPHSCQHFSPLQNHCLISNTFPATRIDLSLKPSRNRRRNTMFQPLLSIQLIIPLLVQEQLLFPPQPQVSLTISIEVWRREPATILVVQHDHCALPHIEEDTHVPSTGLSVHETATFASLGARVNTSTTARLTADEGAAEEA